MTRLRKQVVSVLAIAALAKGAASGQQSEMSSLIRNFEARAAAGTPRSFDEAQPVVERFEHADKQTVSETLPIILTATKSSYASVRKLSVMDLFVISVQPYGYSLLDSHTDVFADLLIDPDTPIRKLTGMALANLRLDRSSPVLPNLRDYLNRADAVTTIGAGVAGLLMQAAPDDPATIAAVESFFRRQDQNTNSRNDLLQSVRIARSHNRDIGREVASYALDPAESTSVQAIETLQSMGSTVILDNSQSLISLATDHDKSARVRDAANRALAVMH